MSRCLRATCLVVAVAVAGGVTAIQAAGRRLGPFYVNPAKQEPLERIGESQAVEQSHRVIEFASVATTSEILEAGPERTPSFRLRLLVGTSR